MLIDMSFLMRTNSIIINGFIQTINKVRGCFMKTKIDYRFKILYAVGMIMVVCGHCSGGGISFLVSDWFPYEGLHLPLFVFCSGYFYKKSSEDNTKRYIVKKIKTLILPLYLYTVFYGILVQLLRYKGFTIGGDITLVNLLGAPITDGHQFVYNLGGWFVVPLFMIEIFNIVVRKLCSLIKDDISEIVFFFASILLGLIGNTMACNGLLYGWWLALVRMLYFVPFFELGIFYKNVLEKYDKLPNFWYFTILFLTRLIIIYVYGKNLSYTPAWCNDFTEGPVMPIVIGFLGIALWMRIATLMEPVLGKSKWINLIADNTYSIMMNQFLGFMLVKTVYACISKCNIGFADFDWLSYKSNIWWYYIPKGIYHTLIIYAVAGIAFSILLQKAIDIVKYKFVELMR